MRKARSTDRARDRLANAVCNPVNRPDSASVPRRGPTKHAIASGTVKLAGTPSIQSPVSVSRIARALVAVPTIRLGRHQPEVDLGRHLEILVHGAVGELDLQAPLLVVVSHRSQRGRTDRRSLNR